MDKFSILSDLSSAFTNVVKHFNNLEKKCFCVKEDVEDVKEAAPVAPEAPAAPAVEPEAVTNG